MYTCIACCPCIIFTLTLDQLAEQVLEPSQELVDRIKSDAIARIGGKSQNLCLIRT